MLAVVGKMACSILPSLMSGAKVYFIIQWHDPSVNAKYICF